MTVVSYYENLGATDDIKVIRIWRQCWQANGFNVRVATRADARTHPRFNELKNVTATFPTLNSRSFEMSSFLRWCAFSNLSREPIVAMDYDVIPVRRFTPRDIKDRTGLISYSASRGPGFMIGDRNNFDRIIDAIINFKHDGEHASDMIVIQDHRDDLEIKVDYQVGIYGKHDWIEKPIIHFGNAYVTRPRSKFIEEHLKRYV